ncbi:TRAP transporter small permease subunit [Roseiarcaceae bacterium H3SJ34-1]|uniref:TRAP transporter small permease subunit n=1 Tax=Terripilifer ovatus TaxID=3032367 RepID=UPI003AB91FF7|nr:TRAP transporter small permease subunit [Roseiarcaceae bacterium H3SJ34-1]
MREGAERLVLQATRALASVGLCLLLALAAMTLADGLARWLAAQPLEGVRDVGALIVAIAIACCLPVGLAERSNVTIRFAETLSPRLGKFLDVVAALLVLVIMGLIAWRLWLQAAIIARDGETTWILQLRTAPFWYVVDIVLWCAVCVQAIVIWTELARLFAPGTSDPS